MQAAQRGKVAAPTQAEAGDPLGSQYGDTFIQSCTQGTKTYWDIDSLSEEQSGQKVLSAPRPNTSSCACHSRLAGKPLGLVNMQA